MKKVNDYLIVGIFMITALLASAVGLRAYSVYAEKKVAEEAERQNREVIMARNAKAQMRVTEMESEIVGMAGSAETLQVFIDETVTVAHAVQERKETGTVSGDNMVALPSSVTGNTGTLYNVTVSGGAVDYSNATFFGIQTVTGNAYVSGNMIPFDNGTVSGSVQVSGGKMISDSSILFGDTITSGNDGMSGNVTVSGNGDVSGNVSVSDNGDVSGNVTVSGNGDVSGNVSVSGNGTVSGNASVSGNGTVSENMSLWMDFDEPEMCLEERRMLKTSYEETIEVNLEDKERIAGKQYDFSQMKIACLGDSITAASNLENEEGYERYAYPARLQELLGVEEVYNLGIGGSSIGRYWSDAFVERYRDIPEDTDIIIVMGGTNDGFCVSDDEFGNLSELKYHTFCGDLNELMSGLREHYPEAVIFFATPLPNILQDYLMSEREYLLPQKNFAEVIRVLAKEYDFELVDLYNSNILDSHDARIITEYIPDGVHGNHEGYQILAERFASEIVKYYDEDR